jgi:hypothetical protein
MNARFLTTFSVALNLALAAGIFHFVRQRSAPAPAARPVPLAAVAGPVATNAEMNAPDHVPAQSAEAFRWSQIAAGDFKTYRDNLRAIHCPEPTVHDIILAEISEQFLQKRRVILAAAQSRFWELAAAGEKNVQGEWEKPMEALQKERDKQIEEVLGGEDAPDETARDLQANRRDQRYAWLPEEKRKQLVALDEKHREQDQALSAEVSRRSDYKLTVADEARKKAWDDELAAARKQLLTPEEFQEYTLRNSSGARWAASLSGFEPTENEWRAVAGLQTEFQNARSELGGAQLADAERASRASEMQTVLNQTIKETLGAERFAQYELAGDGDYQQTRRITKRYSLPDSVARQASEIQKAVVASVNQVRANQSLSPEAQQSALVAIRQETERALTEVLGQKVFGTYREYNGGWLQQLGQVKTSVTPTDE